MPTKSKTKEQTAKHQFQASLKDYQGPLDVLLKMIQKETLDITTIALADIAQQFIDYIEKEKEKISPEQLTEFLTIASQLVLIKAKALMPTLEITEEEEEDIELLKQRLKQYKEIKELAKKLEEEWEEVAVMYGRGPFKKAEKGFRPPRQHTKEGLHQDILLLQREQKTIEIQQQDLKKKTQLEILPIKPVIQRIQEHLKKKSRQSFTSIAKQAKNKQEIIVIFLALLELVKQRTVTVSQEAYNKEIILKNNE